VKIDWGVILLFGSGIALGQALFASGLAKDLGEAAARVSGAHSVWAITGLAIFTSIVLSELASNTAAATVMVPVAIGLSQGAGVNPIPAALGAALGASFGFMLPVSTAPNAIVYSSGLVPSKDMLKAGILLDTVGFVVIWAGLRVALPMMGLS
jgi:sodium-dependent dicarboxylate transporter 2/3/5